MTKVRRIIGAGILAATFAAGIGSGAAIASGSRVRFESSDGRVIVVRDPRGGFLSAEDVATLRLVNYIGDDKAIYRVVYP